jgi:UrcA family protein
MRNTFLFALALIASATTVTPTVAQAFEPVTATSVVRTADLDLSSDSGKLELDHRIVRAAYEVCGEASDVDLEGKNAVRECRAETIARERGIILADTKLEFGARPDGTVVLADEVLTPDSSRFWPADAWEQGHAQPSYDKQIVRDWLTSAESGWDRASGARPPALPDEVVARTRTKYIEAFERLTGQKFSNPSR